MAGEGVVAGLRPVESLYPSSSGVQVLHRPPCPFHQVLHKVNALANEKPGWTAGAEEQAVIYDCGQLREEDQEGKRHKLR